jgi:Zn-dependent protease
VSNFLLSFVPELGSLVSMLGFEITSASLRLAGIFVLCLIAAITVHEFAHAFVAHKLGDPTPEAQGRLTLNPIAHADPVGTLALPIMMALMSPGMLFGWGRPVETQPRHYTRKISLRAGMALVAFAGPLSNLMLAGLTILVVWILALTGVITEPLSAYHPLRTFFSLNIVLFVFNLIPVHPLDGGKVLHWLMGPKYQNVDDFLARYGFLILLVLVFFTPVMSWLLTPFFMLGNTLLNAVV